MKRNAVAWAAMAVAVVALVGSRSYTRPLPASQDVPAEGQQVAKALSDAFNAVAEYSAPSVVQINVEKKASSRPRVFGRDGRRAPNAPQGEMPKELEDMLKRFFGDQLPGGPQDQLFQRQQFVEEGTGSGFVFDDKGHILTNAHVVDGAEKITVSFHDGNELSAKVIGVHSETDVAVIQVDSTDYRPLKFGDSTGLKVGQWVLALGSPFGLDHTVTAGIVSATQRQDVGINQFESFIQTDAAINPGNSGGPLVDLYGRVVGINSAIATASRSNSGVGFAIPINMASRIAAKLIKDGKVSAALMGINIDPVTRKLARQLGIPADTKGLIVTEVGKGTPAEKAGLKVGDIVLSFAGEEVSTRKGLQYLVSTSDIGQSYPLEVLREGKKSTVQVAPASAEKVIAMLGGPAGEQPAAAKPESAEPAPATGAFAEFGFEASPISAELAKKYGWDEKAEGLVVTKVVPEGPAASNGMEEGDRITRVIRDKKITQVGSLEDLKSVIQGAPEVAVFVEDVRRQIPGQFMTITREPSGDQASKPAAPRDN